MTTQPLRVTEKDSREEEEKKLRRSNCFKDRSWKEIAADEIKGEG